MSDPELDRLKREAQAREQARIQAAEDARKQEMVQASREFADLLRRELSPTVLAATHIDLTGILSVKRGSGTAHLRGKDGNTHSVSIFDSKEWVVELYDFWRESRDKYRGNLGDGSLQECLLIHVL